MQSYDQWKLIIVHFEKNVAIFLLIFLPKKSKLDFKKTVFNIFISKLSHVVFERLNHLCQIKYVQISAAFD